MMPMISGGMLALSGSPAASIVVKATVIAALGLAGARMARGSRAAVRHTLLAAAFGAMLALPIASVVAPPVRIAAPVAARDGTAPVTLAASTDAVSGGAPLDANTRVTAASSGSARLSLSTLSIAGWGAGVGLSLLPMILGLWQVRWLRRSALPWPEGQAVADRLAQDAGMQRRVTVLLHEAGPGPMTCGVMRPAIVLSPDARTWGEEELNRAMVHELEHVRRGDWLIHCVARAVCAVYWFHPLVWMARRQLALEAERSCDDAVLGRAEATAYADQLVALARRLVAPAKSPLLAMANRADLVTRVGAVLDSRQRRGRAGALAVAAACVAALALVAATAPLVVVAAQQKSLAQTGAAALEFDAVSVKLIDANSVGEHTHSDEDPVRFSMSASLHTFISRAYGITGAQLSGEPDWFNKHLYSIAAVTSAPARLDQQLLMLRKVLADRFQLKLREEERDGPVYALEVAPGGPKFKALKPGEVAKDPVPPPKTFARGFDSIEELMRALNGPSGGRLTLDRPVLDRTHLTGDYNIQLQTEMEVQKDEFGNRTVQLPYLFHDLQSELGLKLVPDHARMAYFVVEHATEPTAN